MTTPISRTVYRACNLCEAICGLELKIDGERIVSIRGDAGDPFSRGHICPKGVALVDVHDDPNRLRRPMRRVGGEWREVGWEEALEWAVEGLAAILRERGNDAVGVYAGNPSVHNSGTLFNAPQLGRVLRTRNVFSATSVDQLPHQLISLLMYGHQFLIPIPDIDRTDYLLVLGANPIASNGSLMTAPDVGRRLAAIRGRDGKVVVIDPRRTETAEVASEHHFIRPATDAAFLMAMLHVLRAEGLVRVARPERLRGLEAALDAIADVTPDVAAAITGIDAETIRRIARELAAAPSAVVYGRVGTSLQAFGTLNQWLIQLLNLVTGNLDRVGGALLTRPLVPITGPGTRPGHFGQWRSRVRGLPESGGELPVAALAEEILTPGEGQIRAMVTICGNPVLSTPDGRKVDEALSSLEFMIAIDIYLNETTRHADLILPPASSLQHDHYDVIFNALAIRNVARFNEAIWPRAAEERYDWEILGGLSERLAAKLERETKPARSTAERIKAALSVYPAESKPTRDEPEEGLANQRGRPCRLQQLREAIHGIDLGPLEPSLYERLETADGMIDCAPSAVLADVARFRRERVDSHGDGPSLLLIGRRHLRSNNSWMHGSQRLIKGPRRDQLLMHPDDLASLGLADGQSVEVRARTGSVRTVVQATDSLMPGVVSLPHGFGHNRPGTRLGLAEQHAGVSYNDLSDAQAVDAVSGNAALNGVPVTVVAV